MNEVIFILPGSIRSKKNSKKFITVKGRRMIFPSDAYVSWQAAARCAIVRAASHCYKRPLLPHGDVYVEVHAYYKGNRPDLSGVLESVGDALEGYVWVNDSQIVSWDGSRVHHDIKNPRTEVTVRW